MSIPPQDAAADEVPDAAADEVPDAAGPASETGSRRRLLRAMVPRATRSQLLAAVLCGVLGFALVVQVRQNSEADLESLRQSDLVRLLDDASERSERLAAEEADLTDTRDELLTGSNTREAAQEAARAQVAALGVLAGTAPATGPGIRLTVSDPDGALSSSVLLNAVQELRDSGAEAMQVDDARITAATSFTDTANGALQVDGRTLEQPYVLLAIGDPDTLATAMAIPGGVVRGIDSAGGQASVQERDEVLVDALRPVTEPQYARPVGPSEGSATP